MQFLKKIKLLLIAAIIGLIGIAATNTQDFFEISKNLEIFNSVYKELNSYYVDDIDPNEFMQEGIEAMLYSLDPYTTFYSEADAEALKFETTGMYGGIGSTIKREKGYVIITEPYEGYPADKSGLIAGDKIVSVDGNLVKGKSTEEVSKYLKGSPGTKITLKIMRLQADESEKEIEIVVTREEVKVKNVPYYTMIEDDIAYISLKSFTQKASKEVESAYKDLKNQNQNLKGLVLDLRNNPGGLLHEAVNISNLFIDKGQTICSTKGKLESLNKDFKTLNNAIDTEIPIVVLTSRGSASASEIISGVMQDLDRGLVVGQKTFGKGLVQTTLNLEYNTQLKVTTAKYYTPSGRCIQAINYAEKDGNGAVKKVPDSLKVAFQTLNGRTVYDGGGIDPDIETDIETLTDISISLLRKDLLFDYANIYKSKNKNLRDGVNFRLSDSEYNDFVTWLQDKDYDYTTRSEDLLEEFKESAEKDDYFEAIKQEYKELKDKIKHDKNKDLQKQKKQIIRLLEYEIATRFFYKKGAIENSFVYDVDIKKAIDLLNNKTEYNAILQTKK